MLGVHYAHVYSRKPPNPGRRKKCTFLENMCLTGPKPPGTDVQVQGKIYGASAVNISQISVKFYTLLKSIFLKNTQFEQSFQLMIRDLDPFQQWCQGSVDPPRQCVTQIRKRSVAISSIFFAPTKSCLRNLTNVMGKLVV